MNWLRWIGLLLVLLHAVAFVMIGRFWTVLHVAHASSVSIDPYADPYGPRPMDSTKAVWVSITVSLVVVVLLVPPLYLIGREWPRIAPYSLLMILAAYFAIPVFYSLMTPHTVTQRAEQLKYLEMFIANCFFCVMGVLLGTAIIALVDGLSVRTQRVSVSMKKGKHRREPPSLY